MHHITVDGLFYIHKEGTIGYTQRRNSVHFNARSIR